MSKTAIHEPVKRNWPTVIVTCFGYVFELCLIAIYLLGGFSFLQASPHETDLHWGYTAAGLFLIMQATFGRYSVMQVLKDVLNLHRE
jgi:hypothetical protein